MRTDLRRVLTAAALGGLLGCVDRSPASPNVNVLIVQAVLDAGAHDQYVLVQQTDGATARQVAVDGAAVTLDTPDGRVLEAVAEHDSTRVETGLGEPPAGTVYHFALGAATLVPGATYRLRIVTSDGRVATGVTTIPSSTPAPDTAVEVVPFSFLHDTLLLAWARVPGAKSYELHVRGEGLLLSAFTDTSVVLTSNALERGLGTSQLGATSQLVVSAVDANYYDYYRHAPDSFTGNGVISHLDGAIGVFGSLVEVERRTLRFR